MDEVFRKLDNLTSDKLNISCIYLTTLEGIDQHPNFGKVRNIDCSYNWLTSLPCWPNIEIIRCGSNLLTELPLWPNVKVVNCCGNKIEELPCWQNVEEVYCWGTPLTELPSWSSIKKISCNIKIRNVADLRILYAKRKIGKYFHHWRQKTNSITEQRKYNKIIYSTCVHELNLAIRDFHRGISQPTNRKWLASQGFEEPLVLQGF